MLNVLESKQFRGSCPIWTLYRKVPTVSQLVTSSVTSCDSQTYEVTIFKVVAFGNQDLDQLSMWTL